jgi:hypothetical protein
MTTNDVLTDVIAEFGRKYLWWEPVSGQPHSEDRIIAQTMNLATYDDILLLEEAVGNARLLEVMSRAEPGWINDRSWEFWRGRLSFATGAAIPKKLREERFMPQRLEPKFSILPAAQREIWAGLAPAQQLSFVPYDGTAIALHLGHRESLDFDFFRSEPLDKDQIRTAFEFVSGAAILQDMPDTLMVLAKMRSGLVKGSFFGGIGFGRVHDPIQTRDNALLVASLDDLMATKLKATLDRAEAKDYRDIAEMISAGVSLPAGLSAFKQMFDGEPAQVLRALGYFEDGDLATLDKTDQNLLRNARDKIQRLPDVIVKSGSLTGRARR